jgi:hypothetical protein
MLDKLTYDLAAQNQKFEADKKQADLEKANAETAKTQGETAATAAKLPGELQETRAKTVHEYASAGEASANAAKAKATTPSDGLVDEIGTGKIALDRLGYIATKNPELLAAVAAKYPTFDSSKAAAYIKAYQDYTSTKPNSAGGSLLAGGTALEHLKELDELNTVASHIYGTPAYKAYQSKLDTVASELAKFYGNDTIPGIASYRDTLGSTLPGNRHSAIQTQVKSMGDRLDNYETAWTNAAPSPAYEAPMPNLSQKAKDARAALDPQYRARQVQQQTPPLQRQPSGTQPNVIQPGEPTALAADGKTTLVVRNGAWVPAQHQ